MVEPNVVVYISEDNEACDEVLQLLGEYDVPYKLKNITENSSYKKELHANNIYGTPVTFIGNEQVILGDQKRRIKQALGIFN